MIYIEKSNGIPVYQQIYAAIRAEIVEGTRKKDDTLLPIRKMVDELQVSKNTVDRAYQQLIAEGYVRSVPGGGFFVESTETDFAAQSMVKTSATKFTDAQKIVYDFRYESIDTSAFPWTKWRKYVQNALAQEECGSMISYDESKGNRKLREALCTYLRKNRGVNCDVEQLVIFAGTQFAAQSLMGILPKRSYRLGFEEPGYDGMKSIFQQSGNKVVSVELSGGGIDMRKLKREKCDLVYLTPSHQFPTGQVMTLETRVELLDWADANNVFIIEYDYDNEFRHGAKRLPSLQAIDQSERVVYLSTLTKVLSPSIRCAYMVLPKSLLQRYDEKYRFFNTSLPSYHQLALANFIEDGMLDQHAREMSVMNNAKYTLICDLIAKHAEGMIAVTGNPAGSHTLVRILKSTDQLQTIAYLRTRGISIQTTLEYWDNPQKVPQDIFLLGFNSLSKSALKKAVMALIAAVREYEPK